jgi:hypothetical protein
MLRRSVPLCLLLLVPTFANADDVKKTAQTPPTIVVRLASLDTLFDRFKLIGGLMGKEDLGKKLEASLKGKLGPKGLFGIDPDRPIGCYARVGADISDINGILMVPMTGADQFKGMLEAVGWEVSSDMTGLYTVKQNLIPIDVQYRVANDYAYVGLQGMSTLAADGLLTPENIFGANPSSALVSVTVQLNQIPASVREMFIDVLDEALAKVDNKTSDSDAPKGLRTALTKEITRTLENVLKDGEELRADIDVEPKTKQLVVDLKLTAKAGSTLAQNIAGMGQRQTQFAGVLDKDAAMNGLVNLEVPLEMRGAVNGILQESLDKVLGDLVGPGKKQQAANLLSTLTPSLVGDDIDAAFSLRGPNQDKKFTLVAGFKLKQGNQLASTLVLLTKTLPKQKRDAVKLNFDKVDGVAIHSIDLQTLLDAKANDTLGDTPLFVAFRGDALFLAIGEGALPALKQAVAAPATVTAPLQFDVSMARFAMSDKSPTAGALSAIALGSGEDARLHISVEGGSALRLRLTASLAAIKVQMVEKRQ